MLFTPTTSISKTMMHMNFEFTLIPASTIRESIFRCTFSRSPSSRVRRLRWRKWSVRASLRFGLGIAQTRTCSQRTHFLASLKAARWSQAESEQGRVKNESNDWNDFASCLYQHCILVNFSKGKLTSKKLFLNIGAFRRIVYVRKLSYFLIM